MDIQDLRYFVAVAQTMNITKAAEQLYITRQALSKAIHELERECGAELFLRNNGKLQITTLGRELLEKSLPIMDSFNDLEKSVNANVLSEKGRVRIAIGLGTLNTLSAGLFVNFRLQHPEIELSLKEVCDDEVRRDLETEEVEIGIMNTTPEKIKMFEYQLIQTGQVCVQISRSNPLSGKEKITPRDLDGQPFVTLGERVDIHSLVMDKCREAHSVPNLVLETIDSNVANEMVNSNLAISFAIHSKILLDNPAARVIPVDIGDTPWGAYVIYRKGSDPAPAARHLIDYLAQVNH